MKWQIGHWKERLMTEVKQLPPPHPVPLPGLLAALGSACLREPAQDNLLPLSSGGSSGATTQRATRGCFPPFRLWLFEMQFLF